MSKLTKLWLVAMAFAAMGASGAKAVAVDKVMDQAAIERSWAIQAELARIDQDREGFVDGLLGSWAPYVDSTRYNLGGEIKAAAMQAKPWQLYGASLVGDFTTMLKLLRGEIGAGTYINAYSQPQARMPETMAKNLGSGTDSLVLYPIPPCRIVDTRGTGARTGILSGARTFDVTTGGYGKGQGGATSGCTGLPSFSYYGWALNITAASTDGAPYYGAIGWLTAWGSGGVPPTASVVNYFPGAYAIASNVTLAGCYGCVDDIVISANNTGSHVIVDVMGYYANASGFTNGVVTSLAGTSTSVPAGGFVLAYGGTCAAGTTVIGGGSTNSAFGTMITSDHNISGTRWYEYVKNTGGASSTFTVYSICMDAP